jgi:hypothetical protein
MLLAVTTANMPDTIVVESSDEEEISTAPRRRILLNPGSGMRFHVANALAEREWSLGGGPIEIHCIDPLTDPMHGVNMIEGPPSFAVRFDHKTLRFFRCTFEEYHARAPHRATERDEVVVFLDGWHAQWEDVCTASRVYYSCSTVPPAGYDERRLFEYCLDHLCPLECECYCRCCGCKHDEYDCGREHCA